MNKYLLSTIFLLSTLTSMAQIRTSDTAFVVQSFTANGNPIINHAYTADAAALVVGDSLYLYTGHDEAPAKESRYVMHEWLCFSTADMVHWKAHPSPLNVKAFSWAKGDAWASQVIEKNGKYYWFVAVEHATIKGKAIGVAVSDKPTGPFVDALGKALVTNDMTTETKISWDDIDPTVFTDKDGSTYILWGNTTLKQARLKENMIELDGSYKLINLPKFTEAPWVHYRKGWYYLSYAFEFPEKIAYAMSRSIHGPWEYKGILNEIAGNSNTNHQAIIEFKGNWYFIYHNGALTPDAGSYHRSVCIDRLYYNEDGTMKRVVMTSEGVGGSK
jgi:beta-xylosidase